MYREWTLEPVLLVFYSRGNHYKMHVSIRGSTSACLLLYVLSVLLWASTSLLFVTFSVDSSVLCSGPLHTFIRSLCHCNGAWQIWGQSSAAHHDTYSLQTTIFFHLDFHQRLSVHPHEARVVPIQSFYFPLSRNICAHTKPLKQTRNAVTLKSLHFISRDFRNSKFVWAW